MALFIPVMIGLPIGYFTWATVFEAVDNKISEAMSSPTTTAEMLMTQTLEDTMTKRHNSPVAATIGTVASIGVLGKLTFTPQTRHRLFFAKAPANSNIRVETLKLGMELLVRSGIVFYGGAIGGAAAGRVGQLISK